MMMKSVFWWRKPEYPEETTDLRQVTDETFHTYSLCPVRDTRDVRMRLVRARLVGSACRGQLVGVSL